MGLRTPLKPWLAQTSLTDRWYTSNIPKFTLFPPISGQLLAKIHRFCDCGAVRPSLKTHDPSMKLPQRVEHVSNAQKGDFRHISPPNRKNKVYTDPRQCNRGVLRGPQGSKVDFRGRKIDVPKSPPNRVPRAGDAFFGLWVPGLAPRRPNNAPPNTSELTPILPYLSLNSLFLRCLSRKTDSEDREGGKWYLGLF